VADRLTRAVSLSNLGRGKVILAMANIIPGNVIRLKCLGDFRNPSYRYLNGRTTDNVVPVDLAPNTELPFTGTRWLVLDATNGQISLQCLGEAGGSTYLDGRTGDGTVGLIPQLDAQHSGAIWREVVTGPNISILQCMGNIPGPPYLNGNTRQGKVDLAPRTDNPFTGTRWLVEHETLFAITSIAHAPVGGAVAWFASLDGVAWSTIRKFPDTEVGSVPGSAPFLDQIFLAWKGPNATRHTDGDTNIYWASTNDGTLLTTGARRVPNVGTEFGPSLANFKGQLYMVWRGISHDRGIWWTRTSDGQNWDPQQSVPNVGTDFSRAPALAVYGNYLYMAWRGIGDDLRLYWTRTQDGQHWDPQQIVPGVGSEGGPSLIAYRGSLYMAWKGVVNDRGLYWSRKTGDGPWAPQQPFQGVSAGSDPTLTDFRGGLYLIWGNFNDPGRRAFFMNSFDGQSWSTPQPTMGRDGPGTLDYSLCGFGVS
jgi:hypothetical protein